MADLGLPVAIGKSSVIIIDWPMIIFLAEVIIPVTQPITGALPAVTPNARVLTCGLMVFTGISEVSVIGLPVVAGELRATVIDVFTTTPVPQVISITLKVIIGVMQMVVGSSPTTICASRVITSVV